MGIWRKGKGKRGGKGGKGGRKGRGQYPSSILA